MKLKKEADRSSEDGVENMERRGKGKYQKNWWDGCENAREVSRTQNLSDELGRQWGSRPSKKKDRLPINRKERRSEEVGRTKES